jgi:hypothetical protein
VLASQLPPDSRVKSYLSGDDEGYRWSDQTHLAANLVDLLQLVRNEQLARMLGKKDRSKVPKFQATPRPGDEGQADDVDEPTGKADPARYEAIQRFLATMDPPPPGAPPN